MSTSWGIDPLKDANGVVTIGTTSADLRQIQGGLYSPGLISGGLVTRSASALTYTISPGVAAFPIVTGETPQTVLGAIPNRVLTTTAPASGTRLDMIIAEQRTVTTDGDPNIDVRIVTELPPRSVLLDAYIVSNTTANTNAAVRSADIKYSIPFGAPRGLPWYTQRSTFNGTFTATKSNVINGSFYLPSDRVVDCKLSTSLNSSGAIKFDNTKYCEAAFAVYIDSIWKWTWTSGGLHQAMQDYHWSETLTVAQGTHTIRVERWASVGPGTPFQRYGQGNLGTLFEIRDVGPSA